MCCRAHQALPSKPKIIQTGQELMEEWIYLHSLVGIREIGHGFSPYLHTKSPYSETVINIGFSASNRSIYPLEQCSDGRRRSLWMDIVKWQNRTRFCHISTTEACTSKRTLPSDSAHRIGPSTHLNDVLTVEEGVCGWRFRNWEIRNGFN